ncbi:MAG TPA: DNA-binding protein [Polyangiaceae bacterium]|jgi:hypothetical protein|nr:DNA-binding protein [Polyangiaceae bacterium]
MTHSPKIQAIVSKFISDLSAALAEEGSAAITAALTSLGGGGNTPTPFRKRGPGRPKGTLGRKARPKGAKRTSEELEAMTKSLLSTIKRNPGQRIEQIAATMNVSTKDLALPIQKLLASKQIGKKGQRRATAYAAK